jgi:hypothetical protein
MSLCDQLLAEARPERLRKQAEHEQEIARWSVLENKARRLGFSTVDEMWNAAL